jgi:anaerobic magnesium-protoporphyrin IX monomethyl ester cyclase
MEQAPIILISPPLFDARAPHLACPMLAADLEQKGRNVQVMDLNIRGINWLLKPASLKAAMVRAGRRRDDLIDDAVSAVLRGVKFSDQERYVLLRAMTIARGTEQLPGLTKEALSTLRDPELFYHPATHRTARRTIDAALDLQAFACDDLLRVGLCPQQYNGRHRVSSVSDLMAATDETRDNLFGPFFEEVVAAEILPSSPRFVGISISNVYQVIPGLSLARMLRREGVFVIIGGAYFSKFGPRISMRPEFFDLCTAVAVSEGEAVVAALAGADIEHIDLERLPNIIFRRGGRVIATEPALSVEVPDPGAADFRTLDLGEYHIPEPVLPIYLGKGCAWGKCTFCEIPQINRDFGRWRRVREPHRVALEMEIQMRRHGVRNFMFTDEDLEPKRLGELADSILRSKLDVNYMGFTRFTRHHTRDLFVKLARSGCRKLLFGLESGSQKVNDACNKGVDLKLVPQIIDDCQNAGIALHIFTIVGLPEEGEAEATESAEYIHTLVDRLALPASSLGVSPFYLNWNASLRRSAEEFGISFTDHQDFPVHIDDYHLERGMRPHQAQEQARRLYQELRWRGSAAGFDIDYTNPIWPGWEEYTLLYQARYAGRLPDQECWWPRTMEEVLTAGVTVASGFKATRLPSELAPLFTSGSGDRNSYLALAPAAEPVLIPENLAGLLAHSDRQTVGGLLTALTSGQNAAETGAKSLATILQLTHANILQWRKDHPGMVGMGCALKEDVQDQARHE